MAPCCSVFKDQAPETAQRETLSTAGAVSNRRPTCRRERARAFRLAEPEGSLTRCRDGSYQAGPRCKREPSGAASPHQRTVPPPPGEYQQAAAQEVVRCRRLPRVVDLVVVDARGRRRRPGGPPRRCSRRGRRAGTARRTWAARRRPSSSTVGASSSATSSSPGRPRPAGRARTAPRTCAWPRAQASSPCTSTVSSRPARVARHVHGDARRSPRRAPRSPRASGTRTPAGTGPRRRRPVEPELVEGVHRRQRRVEVDGARLRLAELLAVRLGDQREGDRVGLAAVGAADQLAAGRDVAPLVGAADLQPAVEAARQLQVVVGLQQHVARTRCRRCRSRGASAPSPWPACSRSGSACRRRAAARSRSSARATRSCRPGRRRSAASDRSRGSAPAAAGCGRPTRAPTSADVSARSDVVRGSPIRPVPPPSSAIGAWPARWNRARPNSGTRLPTCSEGAVGSKPQ